MIQRSGHTVARAINGNNQYEIRIDVPEFMDYALCPETDPDAFFPNKGGSVKAAKKVCGACPVREECLAWALDNGELWGIWGGMSALERRRLRKARAVA